MTSKRQDIILTYLKQQGPSSRENLEQHLLLLLGQSVSKVTLLRDLDKLVSAALVENPARVELQNML